MTPSKPFAYYTPLLCLLVFGFALRLLHLTAQSIWVDEGFTWFLTQQPDLFAVLKTDVHPPLYFALVTAWTQLAGTSELSLRYFTVLPSVLCLALMVPLSTEMARLRPAHVPSLTFWGYPLLPLLAIVIMAIADIEIYIAQEARAYSLHVLLAMVGVWAMLRWIRTQNRWHALIWVLTSALILYTQYFGAWLLVVEGCYVLIFLRQKQRLMAIGLLIIAGVLFLPWVLGVIIPFQLKTIGGYTPADASTLTTLQNYLVAYFSGQWVLVFGIALLGLGVWRTGGIRWQPLNASVLLWMWVILPMGITFVLNIPNANLLFDYRLSQISPAVALVIALGLLNFAPRTRTFLLLVILIYGALHVDAFRYKEDWRGYSQAILQNVQASDGVVIDFGGGDFQMQYYLEQQAPPQVDIMALRQMAQLHPDIYETQSLAFFDQHDTIWLVRWNTADDALNKLAFTHHEQVTSIPIELAMGMNLWLYRYDRLPEKPLLKFENGLQLQQATFNPHTLTALLWWRTPTPQPIRYTTSVILLNEAGVAVAQLDSEPTPPTTEWQNDKTVWETKTLTTTDGQPLGDGTYQAIVQVYEWRADGIRLVTPVDNKNPFVFYEFSQP